MCDKCSKRIPVKYWLHLFDNYSTEKLIELVEYVTKLLESRGIYL